MTKVEEMRIRISAKVVELALEVTTKSLEMGVFAKEVDIKSDGYGRG